MARSTLARALLHKILMLCESELLIYICTTAIPIIVCKLSSLEVFYRFLSTKDESTSLRDRFTNTQGMMVACAMIDLRMCVGMLNNCPQFQRATPTYSSTVDEKKTFVVACVAVGGTAALRAPSYSSWASSFALSAMFFVAPPLTMIKRMRCPCVSLNEPLWQDPEVRDDRGANCQDNCRAIGRQSCEKLDDGGVDVLLVLGTVLL